MRFLAGILLIAFTLALRDAAPPLRSGGISRSPAQVPGTAHDVLPPHQDRAGFEIELTPAALTRIIHLFDWARIDRENGANLRAMGQISPAAVRSYLDNPAHFDSLPQDLREELTLGIGPFRSNESWIASAEAPRPILSEGATLGRVTTREQTIALRRPTTNQQTLLDPKIPEGFTRDRSGLILPSSTREAIEAQQAEQTLAEERRLRQSQLDAHWNTIVQRWQELPLGRSTGAVRLENLEPETLANIAILSGHEGAQAPAGSRERILETLINAAKGFPLPLRPDLSAETRQTMQGLIWHKDNEGLEFKLEFPATSTGEGLRRARYFARLAGVERLIFEPATPTASTRRLIRQGGAASLHIHFSRSGRRMHRELQLLNLLLLPEAIENFGETAITASQYGFSDIGRRGLVRILPPGDHIEIRYWGNRNPDDLVSLFKSSLDDPSVLPRELERALSNPTLLAVLRKGLSGEFPNASPEIFLQPLIELERIRPSWLATQKEVSEMIHEGLVSPKRDFRSAMARLALSLDGISTAKKDQALQLFHRHVDVNNSALLFEWSNVRHPEVQNAIRKFLRGRHSDARDWANFAISLGNPPEEESMDLLRTYLRGPVHHQSEFQVNRVLEEFIQRATPSDTELLLSRLRAGPRQWRDDNRAAVATDLLSEYAGLPLSTRRELIHLSNSDSAIRRGIFYSTDASAMREVIRNYVTTERGPIHERFFPAHYSSANDALWAVASERLDHPNPDIQNRVIQLLSFHGANTFDLQARLAARLRGAPPLISEWIIRALTLGVREVGMPEETVQGVLRILGTQPPSRHVERLKQVISQEARRSTTSSPELRACPSLRATLLQIRKRDPSTY